MKKLKWWGWLFYISILFFAAVYTVIHFYESEIRLGILFSAIFLIALIILITRIRQSQAEKSKDKYIESLVNTAGTTSPPEITVSNEARIPKSDNNLSTAESKEIFSNNLKYYLNLRHKKTEELAHVIGAGQEEIDKWLAAKAEPDTTHKNQIAKWLNIDPNKLDKNADHSDEAIKDRTFKKATTLFYMINQMDRNEVDTTERFIKLLYDKYNGYHA